MVSEEWFSDCVEKGKLLDVKRYLLEVPPSEEDEVAGVLEDIGMEEEEENGGEEETGHSDPREGDSDGRGGAREASGVEEAINPKEKSAVKKPESSSGGWMSMFTRKRSAPGSHEAYTGKRRRGSHPDNTSRDMPTEDHHV